MTGEYEILRGFLSDRPIAFHPLLARVFGGINEALLFQQLAYWSDKGADPEWIYKTQKDIESEITLTRTQQENARAKLRRLGAIEEDKRGVPAKLFFRVQWNTVYQLLEDYAAQDVGNPQTRLQATSKDAGSLQPRMLDSRTQDRGEPAGKDAGDVPAITESMMKLGNGCCHSLRTSPGSSEIRRRSPRRLPVSSESTARVVSMRKRSRI
jgi:hypothetical protein